MNSLGMCVYLAVGVTDMRKSINTLAMVVEGRMELNPLSGHLFAFCNRRCDTVKVLYWDRNGFCLWQKRLEQDRFRWPKSEVEVLNLTKKQLAWLLDGLEISPAGAHAEVRYTGMY